MNIGGIEELLLLRTLLALCLRAKFLGSDGLFCFSSICKFTAPKTLLQLLLASLNFTLDSENFSVGTKVISVNYSCRKPWKLVRFDMIFMMRDI